MKLELEDINGDKYEVTIPKYPSARIVNKCEATFNAHVRATGSNQEGSIDNAYEALSEQKEIVLKWLNSNWFENVDLGPEKMSPPSQDKVVAQYADYIEGMMVDEQKKS